MQYRENPKNGDKISALGFGCMRFNKNEKEVESEIRYAIENGVNYFDTAYIYGGSEAILGRVLAKDGLRDKVQIATKLPYYVPSNIFTMQPLIKARHVLTRHIACFVPSLAGSIHHTNPPYSCRR